MGHALVETMDHAITSEADAHFLQYIYIIGKQVLGNMNIIFQNLCSEVSFLNFLLFTEQWNSSLISEYIILLIQNIK
jgi:hypothetical protein